MQGGARQLAAEVLASLGSHAPSVTLFPALAMISREGAMASSEEMQQVLGPVKAKHGSLLQEAQLLVQHLREVACLWSEQWMHILRDVQVCICAKLKLCYMRKLPSRLQSQLRHPMLGMYVAGAMVQDLMSHSSIGAVPRRLRLVNTAERSTRS